MRGKPAGCLGHCVVSVLFEVDLFHNLAPTTRFMIRLMAFSVLVSRCFLATGLERLLVYGGKLRTQSVDSVGS